MSLRTLNPATGQTLQTFDELTDEQLEARIARAQDAFAKNRRRTFAERARRMHEAAFILEREKHALGRLMTIEMGKTIGAAIAEAEKCALGCRYYAEHAERYLADETVHLDGRRGFVRYQPIGIVLAIMPWNFPFWQVFRFAAPALMAGNIGLLKHASNVPQCALAIEDVFRRAGFPQGAFQTLLIGTDAVQGMLEDPRVAAVTLTGSEPAGRSVAGIAGNNIKKAVLELGGSDPFIVMPSAKFDEAVSTAVKARTINNGQSCIAAKRFIVHEDIYERFESEFVAAMNSLRVGDPLDSSIDIGPLATEQILTDVEDQVKVSVASGAKILTGGQRVKFEGDLARGHFYEPTVLADIPKDSPAFRDEIFGPVASLFRVSTIDEAIDLANATSFGLGSAAWTNDENERARFIDEIEAGSVFINGMVASDPRLPFGGVKHSGYGRELGEFGIREFVNIKTVWIKSDEQSNRASAE